MSKNDKISILCVSDILKLEELMGGMNNPQVDWTHLHTILDKTARYLSSMPDEKTIGPYSPELLCMEYTLRCIHSAILHEVTENSTQATVELINICQQFLNKYENKDGDKYHN